MTPERLLEALLRPLPESRAAWKAALRAELAALDAPGERWAFALSCWRLPLRALAAPRPLGVLFLALLAAFEVFDRQVKRTGAGGEFVRLIVAVLLVWYLGLLLRATGRRSPAPSRSFVAGAAAALGTTGGWLALTLLGGGIGTDMTFPLVAAAAAGLVAAAFAPRGRVSAVLWAVGGVLLLVPVAANLALDLSPFWPSPLGAPSNRVRNADPYAGLLLLAPFPALVLTVVLAQRRGAPRAGRP